MLCYTDKEEVLPVLKPLLLQSHCLSSVEGRAYGKIVPSTKFMNHTVFVSNCSELICMLGLSDATEYNRIILY